MIRVLTAPVGLLAFMAAATAGAADLPRLERTPCWFDIPPGHEAQCAYLYVAEDRGNAGSAEIRLPVARLMTPDQTVADDPVLFINGGPGGDAGLDAVSIESWWWYVDNSAWMRKRDFILMEVRGTGLAVPNLDCQEMDRAPADGNGDSGGFAGWIDETLRNSDECRDRLIAEGRQLGAYNSKSAAGDIVDLMTAAGIDSMNIYGASYGTRIAFSLLRDHPQRVRSLVLESVLPPNADLVIQQQVGFGQVIAHIAADCAADNNCNARYPDLEIRFRNRLEELNRSPLSIEIFNPASRSRQSYPLIGVDIVDVLFDLMYGSETLRFMPTLLDELSRGNEASLQSWFQAYRWRTSGPDTTSEGVYYSFACAEQVAHVDLGTTAAAAARYAVYNDEGVVGFSDYLICPRWPVPAVDESELQAVISDKPVLLLSGEYDPVTPAAFADMAAATLSHGYHFVLPNAGHAPLSHSLCANEIADAFLDDPMQRPPAGCLDTLN
ncbi:MAG: alpha/beta fold hydrolase [Dongiaceae bacterium]